MKVSKKQADQIIRLCLAANAALKAGIELPRKDNESTEQSQKRLLKAIVKIWNAVMKFSDEAPSNQDNYPEEGEVGNEEIHKTFIIRVHVGCIYIHNSTKQKYELLNVALRESDKFPMAVYKNIETHQTWVRPLNEFAEKFTEA